jgi:hypothetical protein
VQRESADEGALRYATIADAAVEAVQSELCRDDDGKRIDGCTPYPATVKRWNRRTALTALFGAAIPESGLREDVQTGRGRAKHPDDAGGQGRGPGNEACLMQIHPAIAWRFVPDLSDAERNAAAQGGEEREALMRTLVGRDRESLVRCFRTGLRMLATASAHCDWEAKSEAAALRKRGLNPGPAFASDAWSMYSMYGSGSSCRAVNAGKTSIRASTFLAVRDALARAVR